MSSTTLTTIDFMHLWTMSGQVAERKLQKFLLTGLDKVVQQGSDVLAKIKLGKTTATPVIRWMEEWQYPTFITGTLATTTLTFTNTQPIFGKTITASSMTQCVRVDTVLQRDSDGLMVKVSAVSFSDGPPVACTATVAAHGFGTLSDNATVSNWRIIGELWNDYRDVESTRALDRQFWDVGTQIHAETFEIPLTRKNTKFEMVANETEHQIQALLEKLRRQLAYSVLRMQPRTTGGTVATIEWADSAEMSAMCGLYEWIKRTQDAVPNTNVYVDNGGVEIDKAALDNLIKSMWLEQYSNFNQGDWYIVTDPITHMFIHDLDAFLRRKTSEEDKVGFAVDVFDSKIGKSFPILSDQYMRPGTLMVTDFSKAEYGYYQGDKLNRKEIPTKGRYEQWLLSFQTYGVVLHHPHQSLGVIYDLPTTYSS